MMDTNSRLAVLESRMCDLRKDTAEIRDSVDGTNKALTAIQMTLAEAKGGWRTLLLLGGAAGTVGVMFSKLVPWLWGLLPR